MSKKNEIKVDQRLSNDDWSDELTFENPDRYKSWERQSLSDPFDGPIGPITARLLYDALDKQWYCWFDDKHVVKWVMNFTSPQDSITYYSDLSKKDKAAYHAKEVQNCQAGIDKATPDHKTSDVYPESDEPVWCSGKHGPHDLRLVGYKQLANGNLTCRACNRINKRNQKRKRRTKKAHTEAAVQMMTMGSGAKKVEFKRRAEALLKLRDSGLVGDHEYARISQAEFDKRLNQLAEDKVQITKVDEGIDKANDQALGQP